MGKRFRTKVLEGLGWNDTRLDAVALEAHGARQQGYEVERLLRSFFTTLLNNQETIISRLKELEYDIARLRGEVSYLHEERQEREGSDE